MRALNYAQSLDADEFAPSSSPASPRKHTTSRKLGGSANQVPLEVVEAPYRDIGDPLLRYIRELTSDATSP